MSTVWAFHTTILHIIENICISTATNTIVGGLVIIWLIWWTYSFISRIHNLFLHLLEISIVVNIFSHVQICFKFLSFRRIKTLSCILIKIQSFFTFFTLFTIKVPIFWKGTRNTLLSVKVSLLSGTLRILSFILWNFSNEILSINHIAVIKFLTNKSIFLTFSLSFREGKTLLTNFAQTRLEVKVPWQLTAYTLFSIWKRFFTWTIIYLLTLIVWFYIWNYSNVIFSVGRNVRNEFRFEKFWINTIFCYGIE